MLQLLAVVVAVAAVAVVLRWGIVGLWDALAGAVHSICVRLAHGRPHRVDNPVGGDALPPAWGTFAAALEWVPAGVRDEFLPAAERVDTRTFAAGGLITVPDGVDVTGLASAVPLVIRTARPEAVRVERGRYRNAGLAQLRTQTRVPSPPPCGEATCTLDHDERWPQGMPHRGPAGHGSGQAMAKPTVGPVGGSGCSDTQLAAAHKAFAESSKVFAEQVDRLRRDVERHLPRASVTQPGEPKPAIEWRPADFED